MASYSQPEDLTQHVWHALSSEEVLQTLNGREEGLTKEDVSQRWEKFGPNKLPEKKRAELLLVFLRQFKNPLIYVLLIAGIVSTSIGAYNDAMFIVAVLLINSVIGTIQEWKAESSAEALQHTIKTIAKVRRNGRRQEIDAIELVPGDVVVLESGDAIPADLRLLRATTLRVDESLLTGESVPVVKDAQADLSEDTPLGDWHTLLHAGTTVVDGRATGIVCRTGAATEVGHIAASLGSESAAPPLVVRLQQFTRTIAFVILAAVFVLSAVLFYQGAALTHIFLFENIHIFNCRSENRSFYRIPLRSNLLLILAVVLSQGVHILAMYLPGLSVVLEVQPVVLWNWLLLLGIALSILVVMEVYKYLRGRELALTWR